MKIGYQLYSARADVERDWEGTIRKLKNMGYEGVEFAGYFGRGAEDVRAFLRGIGMQVASSHLPLRDMIADEDGAIAFHKALGCKHIAVPYLEEDRRPGAAGFADTIRRITAFAGKCKANGIQLLYHNHDFEFVQLSGEYGLDFLYDAIDPALLMTELDTCWIRYAGEDPVEYLRKYRGRSPVVHVKDYVGVKGEGLPYALIGLEGEPAPAAAGTFQYKPLGYGCQDVGAILDAAEQAGAQWAIVEQDESTERSPLEDAQLSMETVRKWQQARRDRPESSDL
jgi:sugar phosphate isomerase/epimerase